MSFKTFFAIFLLLFAFLGVQGNSAVKADDLTERAKNGDIAASLQLGKEYFQGVKRPLNRALALYYFKLAADAGSPEAMFNIGMCYEYFFFHVVKLGDNVFDDGQHFLFPEEKLGGADGTVCNAAGSGRAFSFHSHP